MKPLFLGVAILLTSIVRAQSGDVPKPASRADLQPRVTIKGGFNRSSLSIGGASATSNRATLQGWHAGVGADLPLLPKLSLQPAILANSKGSSFTHGKPGTENYSDVRIQPFYLELPVNAVLKLPVGRQTKLFAGVGPYIAYAVAGKVKTEGRQLGAAFRKEESIRFGNDAPSYVGIGNPYQSNLKRFDYGMNIVAGMEINQINFSLAYGQGLANIRPNGGSSQERYHNRVGSVSIGIML